MERLFSIGFTNINNRERALAKVNTIKKTHQNYKHCTGRLLSTSLLHSTLAPAMSAYCLLKPDLNSSWLDIGLSESTQQPSLSECISIVLWFMWLSVFMCCVVNLLAPTHLPADNNRWSVGPLHPYTVFLCRPMRNCC